MRWITVWAIHRVLPESALATSAIAEATAAAVPDCIAAGSDPDERRRRRAIEVLALYAPTTTAAGPVLVAALRDPATRAAALGAGWADLGESVAPALVKLLGEPDAARAARGALLLVGWPAMNALRAVIDTPTMDPGAREAAWEIMQRIGDTDDPADTRSAAPDRGC